MWCDGHRVGLCEAEKGQPVHHALQTIGDASFGLVDGDKDCIWTSSRAGELAQKVSR